MTDLTVKRTWTPVPTKPTKGRIWTAAGTDTGIDTFELPGVNNTPDVSCVGPFGPGESATYTFGWETTGKHPQGVRISHDVPGRDDIEFHVGNYAGPKPEFKSDVDGCILPGHGYGTDDSTGATMILNSGAAYKEWLALNPDHAPIKVTFQNPDN